MNEKKEFKPYIPADKVMPELTVTSVIIGVLLAILFGGANYGKSALSDKTKCFVFCFSCVIPKIKISIPLQLNIPQKT